MTRFVSVLVSGLLASTSFAYAAQSGAVIQDVGGKVLVNKGEGFVPVLGPVKVVVGDTVMIGDKSSATLAYGECVVVLEKPAVFTVTEAVPCAQGVKVDGVFVSPTADVDYEPTVAPFAWPLPVIGTVVAAAAVTAVVVVSGNSGGVSAP